MNELLTTSTPDEIDDQLVLALAKIQTLENQLSAQTNANNDSLNMLIRVTQVADLSNSVGELVHACLSGGTITKTNIEFIDEMMKVINYHAKEMHRCLVKQG